MSNHSHLFPTPDMPQPPLRQLKKNLWQKNLLAFLIVLLICFSLFLFNLWYIFQIPNIQKKLNQLLRFHFQTEAKIQNLNFQIFEKLHIQNLSLHSPHRFSLQLQQAELFHHPLLALLGIYYPLHMEIHNLSLTIAPSLWQRSPFLHTTNSLGKILSLIPSLNIHSLHLYFPNSTYFPPFSLHFPHANGYKILQGYLLTASSHLTSLYPSLNTPWDSLETRLVWSKTKKILEYKSQNFRLHPKTYPYLPKSLQPLLKKEKPTAMIDFHILFNFKQMNSSGYLHAYLFSLPQRELTKGKILLTWKKNKIHSLYLNAIHKKKILWLKYKSIPTPTLLHSKGYKLPMKNLNTLYPHKIFQNILQVLK
ncbi:MAG: hypothetical protein D6805_04345 [Planctomycetota bacterium]|nr:MAG: hypothetical protein D6805_04345 [Planctomycetota bacterium]